ncbi:MAG: hypothetical protein WDO19_11260 [Bacteroidota bacterium]
MHRYRWDSSVAVAADSVIKQTVLHHDQVKRPSVDSAIISVPELDSSWKSTIRSFAGKSFKELVYAYHPYFAFNTIPFIADSDN